MPKKILKGKVVSDKMDKTVVVEVERFKEIPKYKKKIRQREKYKIHDPENAAKIGDILQIEESRPISKGKRWIIKSKK